jgi:hypothetical protein
MADLSYGMIHNVRVCDVLRELWRDLPAFSIAVVRCIDSTNSEEGVAEILKYHGIRSTAVNGNICVEPEVLFNMTSQGIFAGFDEIWLLQADIPPSSLRSVPSATSDGSDFSRGLVPEIADAMRFSRCCLVLADGCGLNYATTNRMFAEQVATIAG